MKKMPFWGSPDTRAQLASFARGEFGEKYCTCIPHIKHSSQYVYYLLVDRFLIVILIEPPKRQKDANKETFQ